MVEMPILILSGIFYRMDIVRKKLVNTTLSQVNWLASGCS
jgi:hypothetical protein